MVSYFKLMKSHLSNSSGIFRIEAMEAVLWLVNFFLTLKDEWGGGGAKWPIAITPVFQLR